MNTIDSVKNADLFTTYPQDAEGMTERDGVGLSSNSEGNSNETGVTTQADTQAQASAQAQVGAQDEAQARAEGGGQGESPNSDVRESKNLRLKNFINILKSDTLGGNKYALGAHAQGHELVDSLESATKTTFGQKDHHVMRRLKGCFRFKSGVEDFSNSTEIERANYRLSVPIKWRTNLKSADHNKAMRTAIGKALDNEFEGVKVPKNIRTAISNDIDSPAKQAPSRGTWNTRGAVESNEVSEMLYRYCTVLNTTRARNEIFVETVLDVIKKTSNVLERISAESIGSYLKYLGVSRDENGELSVGETGILAELASKHQIHLESDAFELDANGVRKLKLNEKSLEELKEKADGFLDSVRAAVPALTDVLAKAVLNADLCAAFQKASTEEKVRDGIPLSERERAQIREFLFNAVKNDVLPEGASDEEKGEVETLLDEYCAGPGDRDRGISPLDALLERMFRAWSSSGNENKSTADFIKDITADAKAFVKGCRLVRQKVGELLDVDDNGTVVGLDNEIVKKLKGKLTSLSKEVDAVEGNEKASNQNVRTYLQDVFVDHFSRFFGKEHGRLKEGMSGGGIINMEIRAKDLADPESDGEGEVAESVADELRRKADASSLVQYFFEGELVERKDEDAEQFGRIAGLINKKSRGEFNQLADQVSKFDLGTDDNFAKAVLKMVGASAEVSTWVKNNAEKVKKGKLAVIAHLKLWYREAMLGKSFVSLGQSIANFSARGPLSIVTSIGNVLLGAYNTVMAGINVKKASDVLDGAQNEMTFDEVVEELHKSFTENDMNLDDEDSIVHTLMSKMTEAVNKKVGEEYVKTDDKAGVESVKTDTRVDFLRNKDGLSSTVVKMASLVSEELKGVLKTPWTFSFFGKNYFPFTSADENRLGAFEKKFESYLEHIDDNAMLSYLGLSFDEKNAADPDKFRMQLKSLCRVRLLCACNAKMQAAVAKFAQEIGEEYASRKVSAADGRRFGDDGYLQLKDGEAYSLSAAGKERLKALVVQELDLGFQDEVDRLVKEIVSPGGEPQLNVQNHGKQLPTAEAKLLDYDTMSETALNVALTGKEDPTPEEVDKALWAKYPQAMGFYRTAERAKLFLRAGFLKGIYNDTVLLKYSEKGSDGITHLDTTDSKTPYVDDVRKEFAVKVGKDINDYMDTLLKAGEGLAETIRGLGVDGFGGDENFRKLIAKPEGKQEDWGGRYLVQLCMDELVLTESGEKSIAVLNNLAAKRHGKSFLAFMKKKAGDENFRRKVESAHKANVTAFVNLRDRLVVEPKDVLDKLFSSNAGLVKTLQKYYRVDAGAWQNFVSTQLETDEKIMGLITSLLMKERESIQPEAKYLCLSKDSVRDELRARLIPTVAEELGKSWLDAVTRYEALNTDGKFEAVDGEIKGRLNLDGVLQQNEKLQQAYQDAKDNASARVFVEVFNAYSAERKLDDKAFQDIYRSEIQKALGTNYEWVGAALDENLKSADSALKKALTGMVDRKLADYVDELAPRCGLTADDFKAGNYKDDFSAFRESVLNAVKARVTSRGSKSLPGVYEVLCNPGDKQKVGAFSNVVEALFADFNATIGVVSVEGMFKDLGLDVGFHGVPKFKDFVRDNQGGALADKDRFADWVLSRLEGTGLRVEKKVITEAFASVIKTGTEVDQATYAKLISTILERAIGSAKVDSPEAAALGVAKWTFDKFSEMSKAGEFWLPNDSNAKKNLLASAFCLGLEKLGAGEGITSRWMPQRSSYTGAFAQEFYAGVDGKKIGPAALNQLLDGQVERIKAEIKRSSRDVFLRNAASNLKNRKFVRNGVEAYCKYYMESFREYCKTKIDSLGEDARKAVQDDQSKDFMVEVGYDVMVDFYLEGQLKALDEKQNLRSRLDAFVKDKTGKTYIEVYKEFANQLLCDVFENYYLGSAVVVAMKEADENDLAAHAPVGPDKSASQPPSHAVAAFQQVYNDELAMLFGQSLKELIRLKVKKAPYDPVSGTWIDSLNAELLDTIEEQGARYVKCARTRNWVLLQMNKWLFDRGTQFELAYLQELNRMMITSDEDRADYWEMKVFQDVAEALLDPTERDERTKNSEGRKIQWKEANNAHILAKQNFTEHLNGVIQQMLDAEEAYRNGKMTKEDFAKTITNLRNSKDSKRRTDWERLLHFDKKTGKYLLIAPEKAWLASLFFDKDSKFHKRLQKCVSRKLSALFSQVLTMDSAQKDSDREPDENPVERRIEALNAKLDANLSKVFGIYEAKAGQTGLSFKEFFDPLRKVRGKGAEGQLAAFLRCFDLVNNEKVAKDYTKALALDSLFKVEEFETEYVNCDEEDRELYANSIIEPSKDWLKEVFSELTLITPRTERVVRQMNEFKFYADQFYNAEMKKGKDRDEDWIKWYESKDVANIEEGFFGGKTNKWKASDAYRNLLHELQAIVSPKGDSQP